MAQKLSHPIADEWISIAEFARRAKCDRVAVRRAIVKGLLSKNSEDLLPASKVDGQWRKPNRTTVLKLAGTKQKLAGTSANVPGIGIKRGAPETPEQAAERIVMQAGPMLSLDGALKLKENYLGRLKQLEYDLKAGAVHVSASCASMVGQEYARVRTKVLAIPSEQAPALFRCQSVAEIEDALRGALVEALEALISDEPTTASPEHQANAGHRTHLKRK